MLWKLLGAWIHAAYKMETLFVARYWIGKFARAGARVSIGRDFQAYHPDCIHVGNDVSIAHRVTLRAIRSYPWTTPPQSFSPRMVIGDGCFINNGSQIACVGEVIVGRNVMIAENCFLSDHNHEYSDPGKSIKEQPLTAGGRLTIGDDTWIGAGCCVAGGRTIGTHCVIGANSVVTTDVPDFSVAAGVPARILRRYDTALGQWVRPDSDRPDSEQR
ncbi:MAG: acyltransferase [Kiritimatiellae bacterium]|nr:acyltransferase [Kiritimatiellia bacterium]